MALYDIKVKIKVKADACVLGARRRLIAAGLSKWPAARFSL
jgi:hypothetical protein